MEKLPKHLEELAKRIDKAGLQIKFGLEQQGHIETIESILNDYGSNDYSWDKIANKIGWEKNAVRDSYIMYLRDKIKTIQNEKF